VVPSQVRFAPENLRRNWWNSGQTLAGGGGCAQLFGGLELSHQAVPISFTRGPDNWSKYGDTGSRHLLYFYGNCKPKLKVSQEVLMKRFSNIEHAKKISTPNTRFARFFPGISPAKALYGIEHSSFLLFRPTYRDSVSDVASTAEPELVVACRGLSWLYLCHIPATRSDAKQLGCAL
jgi:hypothetical protein